jgi:hypothetical protein
MYGRNFSRAIEFIVSGATSQVVPERSTNGRYTKKTQMAPSFETTLRYGTNDAWFRSIELTAASLAMTGQSGSISP